MEAIPVNYLDTHTLLWVYFGEKHRLSASAIAAFESADVRISPAVLIEIQLLYEAGRIAASPDEVLVAMQRDFSVMVCPVSFYDGSRAFYSETWTRDLFDRLIVAHARAGGGRLITKDRHIREHFSGAVW